MPVRERKVSVSRIVSHLYVHVHVHVHVHVYAFTWLTTNQLPQFSSVLYSIYTLALSLHKHVHVHVHCSSVHVYTCVSFWGKKFCGEWLELSFERVRVWVCHSLRIGFYSLPTPLHSSQVCRIGFYSLPTPLHSSQVPTQLSTHLLFIGMRIDYQLGYGFQESQSYL